MRVTPENMRVASEHLGNARSTIGRAKHYADRNNCAHVEKEIEAAIVDIDQAITALKEPPQ